MNERDKNRDIQLERLFLESRASLPELEADPSLPERIRALAAVRTNETAHTGAPRHRWGWLSLAGATVALSICAGGYVGYRAWATSQDTASEQMSDADAVSAALGQSGLADDLAEVQE